MVVVNDGGDRDASVVMHGSDGGDRDASVVMHGRCVNAGGLRPPCASGHRRDVTVRPAGCRTTTGGPLGPEDPPTVAREPVDTPVPEWGTPST